MSFPDQFFPPHHFSQSSGCDTLVGCKETFPVLVPILSTCSSACGADPFPGRLRFDSFFIALGAGSGRGCKGTRREALCLKARLTQPYPLAMSLAFAAEGHGRRTSAL